MRICQTHWNELRAAIEARGLSRFVSNDGRAAAEKIQAQLQPGESKLAGFDPLLNANFAIFSNAVDKGGVYLVFGKEDGTPYCPLCELEAHTPEKASTWIGYAADEQHQKAQALKLIPEDRLV